VDPETARRLAALGYVGAPRDRGEGPLPNPRDNLRSLAAIREGFRLAASGQAEEAIGVFQRVVRESPAMVEAWIKLGELLHETGRFEEAAAAFQQALSRTPVLLGDVAVELGHARLRSGKLAEAAAAADLALASNPARARELLARIALARGRPAEAEQQARDAVGTRSVQPSSLVVLAEVLIARGDFTQALQVLDQAQQRATELRLPSVGRLEFFRADALARSGRPREAEQAYRREIGSFPGNLQAYANLAVLYFLQRNERAVDDVIAEMVRANPKRQAYDVATRSFEALGDQRRAALWRSRARSVQGG
jgi:tetratricopeptide (TPR) repeat protein